jgi:hypothetical protein
VKLFLRSLAVLITLGALAATAPAQGPVPTYAGPDCGPACGAPVRGCRGCCGGGGGNPQYGVNPWIRWFLSCGRYQVPRYTPAPAPPPTGGTLVFPNHPFARSPRDYFMVDVP